jgi:hypothetical protein
MEQEPHKFALAADILDCKVYCCCTSPLCFRPCCLRSPTAFPPKAPPTPAPSDTRIPVAQAPMETSWRQAPAAVRRFNPSRGHAKPGFSIEFIVFASEKRVGRFIGQGAGRLCRPRCTWLTRAFLAITPSGAAAFIFRELLAHPQGVWSSVNKERPERHDLYAGPMPCAARLPTMNVAEV